MARGLFAGFLVRVAVGIAVTGIVVYAFDPILAFAFVVTAWGALLAKPIIEFFPAGHRFLRWLVWRDWQGRYYAFQNRQIRILMDGRAPWLVGEDVLAAIGEQPSERLLRRFDATEYDLIPGSRLRGFSEKGVLRLAQESRHPDAHKFRLWLEREVFGPLHRRHAMEDTGAIKKQEK